MDLSVIILNYNTKDLLRKCLQSVFNSRPFTMGEARPNGAAITSFQFEVIVADNGSTDGSMEMIRAEFPKVKIVENAANLGFAKGNNQAIKIANGKYILLLNSDTQVKPEALDLSIKYLDAHADAGALGAKVLLPDGSLDKACRRNFPNPWNSFLRLFGFKKFSNYNVGGDINQESEVDSVMGAYMMVSKKVIDKVGVMDEEFFMYGEDLDWCYRIKQAGYKVVYYPKAEIIHFKYGSSKNIPFKVIRWAHDAMKIFYRKHYAKDHNFIFNSLVYLGISTRMLLVLIVNLFRNKKTVH